MPDNNGMVFGTSRSRLAREMNQAHLPEEDRVTFSESDATLSRYREGGGLANPYGGGLSAYEPNSVIFSGYKEASDRVGASKAKEAYDKALASASSATYNFGTGEDAGQPLGDATGKMGAAINAALDLANRRVPYVWGGTSRNGVDCSGLIYYAFKAAGIDTQRYRAVDYGHMGQAVSIQDARPGDIIYYDEPGDTDHVGIYLGNGKMVQAPQTGDVVRVSNIGKPTSIRRIFSDDAFQQVATPEGGAYWQYGNTTQTSGWGSATATPSRSNTTIARTSPWRQGQTA